MSDLQQIVDKIEKGEEVTRKDLESRDKNDDNKDTPFLYACRNSTINTLKKVLKKMEEFFTKEQIMEQENAQGYSGLHVAIESSIDTLEKVIYLVKEYGFDVKKSAGEEAREIKGKDTYVNEFAGTPYEKIPQEVREINLAKKNNGANETRYGELTPLRIAINHHKDKVINYLRGKMKEQNEQITKNSVGGKRTKKRKLNKRKKTQKKLKKKTRKQKKSKRKTTKRK